MSLAKELYLYFRKNTIDKNNSKLSMEVVSKGLNIKTLKEKKIPLGNVVTHVAKPAGDDNETYNSYLSFINNLRLFLVKNNYAEQDDFKFERKKSPSLKAYQFEGHTKLGVKKSKRIDALTYKNR